MIGELATYPTRYPSSNPQYSWSVPRFETPEVQIWKPHETHQKFPWWENDLQNSGVSAATLLYDISSKYISMS
jgi:hypothetical protein